MPTPAGFTAGGAAASFPTDLVVFAEASRTASPIATTNDGFDVPYGTKSLTVVTRVKSVVGTPSIVVNIEGYNAAAAEWQLLLAGQALIAAATATIRVGPECTAAANFCSQQCVPARIRVRPVHTGTDAALYSVLIRFSH